MFTSFKCKARILKVLIILLSLYTLALSYAEGLPFTLYPLPLYAATPPPCNPNIPGNCPAGLQQIEDVVKSIITAAVGLGFIAMLVMLVTAGIKYLTSGGEPKAVQAAHLTFTWALLGILFFAVAWLILQLIRAFTGIDVTVFDIKALCGGSSLPFCK